MNCNIISTGSGGNAVLLNGSILVDCGVSWKQLAPVANGIKLVLLTHSHGDHFRPQTVKRLADERPTIRWACCSWMLPLLAKAGVATEHIDCVPENRRLRYPALGTVRAQSVYHDVPNCCWHIEIGTEKAFYCTDAGYLDGIHANEYNLYLLEANHGEQEITARTAEKDARGEYAYERRAAQNHLSKEQANAWLMDNAADWSRIVYLHEHCQKKEEE